MPTPRIKVLQVTEDLGIGGLERVVATLCRTLDSERFDCRVVCLRGGGPFADELRAEGFSVVELPYEQGRPDYLAFWHLARLVRLEGIDVVHTHNTNAFIAGGIASILARDPTLVHTDHARVFPDKLRYMVAEHLLALRAFRVIGVSEHTTKNLAQYEKIPAGKLLTIHNGISPVESLSQADIEAKRLELRIPAGAPVMGLGSRLTEQKNLTMLLSAFKILKRMHPELILVLCGDGPLLGSLRQRAAELELTSSVRFTGFRTDMIEIVRLFDLYILTSHWEGLPMSILEAMQAGVPIVSTDVGGIAAAVKHEESGLLVKAGDPAGFAAAVSRLLNDHELRLRFGQAGRRRFREGFSAEAMTRQYAAIYSRRPELFHCS